MRIVAFMIFWLAMQPALSAGLPVPVAKALREAGIPQESAGILVQQVDSSKPLISHNASHSMNPASTMKLLTTAAALDLLGPAYTWHTGVLTTASLKDGVLEGDLIVKGGGDPALTLERFWALLHDLRQQGVREIRGDVLLDSSYFAVPLADTGSFDGQPDRAYNALPDALLVNFKATRFVFKSENGQVNIAADPDLPQLRVNNRVQPSPALCEDWKEHLTRTAQRDGEIVTLTFSGHYPLACGEKVLELSVLENTSYVGQLFQQYWRELGGTLTGTVKPGGGPANAGLLTQSVSLPLADVVRLVNKFSNNVMARQLLLTLGAEQGGVPGSVDKGVQAIQRWLAAKGNEWPELVLENGAGLSRNERISPQHLGNLLLQAWRSPNMPELMSSLPIVAVDGTMQHRLNDSAVAGQAHIKTGSLDGVKSMAGYLLDAKGRRWVVVCMVNHANASAARAAMDALLDWLYHS